jgi:hypothetical protein
MRICQACSTEISDHFNFCPNCGTDLGKPIKCKKCGYSNEPNSKFCQECGTALFDKYQENNSNRSKLDNIRIEIPDPPSTGITIEFPHSSAQSFEFAVMEAKKFKTFEQFGTASKALYRINVIEEELFRTIDLLEHLKGWRKRTVYHNGQKVLWDTLFSFQYCYVEKLASYKPEYYCFGYENDWEFNLWGCMKTGMPFTEYSKWFTYGKWLNNSGDWLFDKDRIKLELAKNIHYCKFCPAINLELIQEVLTAIPDVVNPNTDKNWKFKQTYSDNGTGVLSVIDRSHGFEQTVYYEGVIPNGKLFIKDIAKNIKRKLPEFLL